MKIFVNNYSSLHDMDLWNSKVGVHFFTSCVVSIVCIVLFSCLS
jgi:hypothetical protein